MNIKAITMFKCSDGKLFEVERKAILHQQDLALNAIDAVMRNYGSGHPEIHYPNLSLSLVPFMQNNAKILIKALKLADLEVDLQVNVDLT